MRVCSEPGCPVLVRGAGRCPLHRREKDRARGTRQQRGYDSRHDRMRADWAPRVEAGEVDCWRCETRILPGTTWNLGHDDNDRRIYRGPEHERCNLSAGGRAAHNLEPFA